LENDRDHLERVVAERTAELQSQAGRLAEALEEERKLAGLQRQFVARVSHEFRTPLAIIDGHAQRILRRSDASLPERVQGRLVKIRHTVTRLIELMESVLAAARLEDGRIIFSPGPCALADLIAEVAAGYGDLNPDYKIILDLDQLPESITADGKLLRQVFSNLISNGIKYSPGGSHLWIHGRVDEAGDMVVTVRDEGVGIPAAEQEQLFERFFRASTSSGIAGSGIGLHLASHLVHMHGGVIDVDSIEGEGTTFRVRLPTRPATAPIADEPGEAPSTPAPQAPQPSSMLQAS
jgi:signal transduction histidine kinase